MTSSRTSFRRVTVAAVVLGGVGIASTAFWQPARIQGPTALYAQQAATSESAKMELDKEAIAGADQLSAAFRNVAKSLRPSVVSIQALVDQKPAQRATRGRRGLPPGIPEEFAPFFGGNSPFGGGFDFPEEQEDEPIAPNPGRSNRREAGLGSGFIVSPNGYILTNNHVVEGADQIEVKLSDDRKLEAKVVGTDPKSDVAVLKVEASGLTPARFGDSSALEVGDWVIAIGSPFGLTQSVTSGIVSATHREDVGITSYDDFIQTDAAINPGNSGGPLLNLRGEVIGINTAIASRGGGFNGIGFAIPSTIAESTLQSILRDGKVVRGFIGTSVATVTPERAEELGLPPTTEGVYVDAVAKGGPAEVGGVKPGDIIIAIDGQKLTAASRLTKMIALNKPGTVVTFTVLRNGKNQDLKITIDEQTDEKLAKIRGDKQTQAVGITVEEIPAEVAKEMGLDSRSGGVLVKEVDRSSPAARAIKPGEVIVEVNGIPVSTPAEFAAASTKSKNGLRLMVRNNSSTRMVIIR